MTPAEPLADLAMAELGDEAGAWFCERVDVIAAGVDFQRAGFSSRHKKEADALASAYITVLGDLRRKEARRQRNNVRFLDEAQEERHSIGIAEIENRARAAAQAAVFASVEWKEGVNSKLKEGTVEDICEALAAARDQELWQLVVGRRSDRDVAPDGNVALVVAALRQIGVSEAVDTTRKRITRIVNDAAREAGCKRKRKIRQAPGH